MSESSVCLLGREVWRRKETTSINCLVVPAEARHTHTHSCWGKEGRDWRASPVPAQQDVERFSWDLFIVSIIPGNEDSAIRTQLAVVLGMCEAE